jgi:hypothetical protein
MSVATGIDKDRARIGGYQKGIGLRIVRWMISRLRQGDGRVQGSVRILALSVPSATSDSWIRIVAPLLFNAVPNDKRSEATLDLLLLFVKLFLYCNRYDIY